MTSSGDGAGPASSGRRVKLDLAGVYPPIATPFDNNENVDYNKLGFNLQRWNDIPFRGYVVLGSNGESTFLSVEERVEMVRRVRQLTAHDRLVIAGAGCESTRETVEMTRRMSDAGADAVLVITPCFYKNAMDKDALYKHFHSVADASPLPVILYSVPANTGLDLPADVVIRLASHDNIIGLKDSGGDVAKLADIVYKTENTDLQVLAGSAGFLYPALTVGCVGGICALANVLGVDVCLVQSLYVAGQHHDARLLQQRLVAPNAAVTRGFGVAGLKLAMDWFGFYGGPTRAPLSGLSDTEAETLRRAFTDSAFSP